MTFGFQKEFRFIILYITVPTEILQENTVPDSFAQAIYLMQIFKNSHSHVVKVDICKIQDSVRPVDDIESTETVNIEDSF